jgi:ribosomal protein S26
MSKHLEVVPPVKKLLNNFYKNLRKTTVWQICKKIYNKNKYLVNCLFFVQIQEVA